MSYREWESALMQALKGLPTAECIKITSYYREIYGDKLDAGITEEDIVAEFGNPLTCAQKIISENGNEQNADTVPTQTPSSAGQKVKGIILAVLFTIFAGLPLIAVMLSIIVSLGAICISGGAGLLGGPAYIFIGAFNASGVGIAAHIGMAIGGMGVCGFLAIGGYFATKYTAIYCFKAMKFIYRGILK